VYGHKMKQQVQNPEASLLQLPTLIQIS